MKWWFYVCATWLGLTFSALPATAAVWRISHIRPVESVIQRDLERFAAEVREATEGRIDIQIYGASQLGDYTVVQERISLGAVEMGCMSVSTLVDKRLLCYILPYVAEDYEAARKKYASGTPFAQYCAGLFKEQNIMVLANWPVYFGGIGLTREPAAPLDPDVRQGLKVRVPPTKIFESLAYGFGYQTLSLPFSEFFTAAQTGMVEGMFGGGAENAYTNARDVLSCYIAANTHFENWPLLINLELFESLSDADKAILLEKSAALEERRWHEVEADQARYEEKLRELGWAVYRLTPGQQAAFAAKGRETSWPMLRNAVGEETYRQIQETILQE